MGIAQQYKYPVIVFTIVMPDTGDKFYVLDDLTLRARDTSGKLAVIRQYATINDMGRNWANAFRCMLPYAR